MKNKILKRVIAAVLSLGVSVSAYTVSFAAAVRNDTSALLFSDDFESYTAGAVSAEAMPRWYMKDDIGECAIAEAGDNKALKVRNTNGAPVLALKQGTISPKLENIPVKISFDIQVPSGTDEVWGLICPVMEESGDNTNYGQNQMMQVRRAGSDTTIQIKHADNSFNTINISNDAWYNVTIEENLGNAGQWSYAVTVRDESGAITGKDYEANSPYMGSFQNINFTSWRNGAYHIDNVSIEKISRGLEISDDMEYASKAEASKYWRINGDNYGFKQIDEAHGHTAYSGGAEFHTCVASEPIESGSVVVEFDTYIEGNTNGNSNNCGRFNAIDKNSTGNPGGNTIVRFDQRANDENVDLYIGDNWINQLQKDWYHVKILLNLDEKNYTVDVINSNGNNYCDGKQNAVENTTRAIDSLALINFTSWADNFYFDNVKIKVLSNITAEFDTLAEYRYDGEQDGKKEASLNFVAAPSFDETKTASEYGFWFVSIPDAETIDTSYFAQGGEKELKSGDSFYYTKENIDVTAVKDGTTIDFWAIPWVKISGNTISGSPFKYKGAIDIVNVGKVYPESN